MSEPDVIITTPSAASPGAPSAVASPVAEPGSASARRGPTRAEWMLLLATAVWGTSFALAKQSGEAINRAAGEGEHALGPIMTLALRFTLATLAWLAIMPRARVGWTARGLGRGALLGSMLTGGLVLQHIALDHSTEAVTAFLTSLTAIFVPLILWIVLRQRIAAAAWVAAAIALPGVWLMSGADSSSVGLGIGEALGLACALMFALHLPLINVFARTETPYRLAAGQFATVALLCWVGVGVCAMRIESFDWRVLASADVWLNVVLLVIFPTLVSFGLVNIHQPKVEPVRAALVYLLEPIFAATFAWLWAGRSMTGGMIVGGALILAANAIVEVWPALRRRTRG